MGARFGFGTTQWQRDVGNVVAARKLRDAPHIPIVVFADQPQAADPLLELAAAARRKHRDDDVGHLRNLRHQRHHRFSRHLDHPCVSHCAHRHRPSAAVQKGDLAHKLCRTERRGQMAFVGVGIHHFDLAFLDIHEAIHRLAGPRQKRALRIARNRPGGAQCIVREPGPGECAASDVNRRQLFPRV